MSNKNKEMKILEILCFEFLVVTAAGGQQSMVKPDGPHFHPIYKYSCNEDLSITFKGVNGDQNAVTYYDAQNKPPDCKIEVIGTNSAIFKISKECLTPPENIAVARSVTVQVIDKNEEGEQPVPVDKTKFIAAHHLFKLTCDAIPNTGVDRMALAETGVTDVDETGHVNNEVKGIEMRLKEVEHHDAPDISEVYIGDMFFMYIRYLGDRSYRILPTICNANKGTYRLETAINLWTIGNDLCLSPDSINFKIMGNFTRDNDKMVHSTLHAFRFSGDAGSNDITIFCNVKICMPNANDQCKEKCMNTTPSQNGRRRRQTETNTSLQIVSRSFKVKVRANSGDRFKLAQGLIYVAFVAVIMKKCS